MAWCWACVVVFPRSAEVGKTEDTSTNPRPSAAALQQQTSTLPHLGWLTKKKNREKKPNHIMSKNNIQ